MTSGSKRGWVRVGAGFAIVVSWLPAAAPATIQEQRARLPPPAECNEPVVGVWKSHQHDPRFRDWTVFMLDLRWADADKRALTGTITNHSWEGGAEQEEPAPCSSGNDEWVVSMDGTGHVDPSGQIAFGGVGQWRLDRILCNGGPGGYNLDRFTGVIDIELNEFQSVNNDGGRAVNDPTVFRRVSCHQGPQNPRVVTEPPPFYPKFERGGCG